MRVGRPNRPVKQPAGAGETNRRLPPSRQGPPTEGGRGRPFSGSALRTDLSAPAGPPAASAASVLCPRHSCTSRASRGPVAMALADYRLIRV